jgi:hypothetical protein
MKKPSNECGWKGDDSLSSTRCVADRSDKENI